MSKSVTRNITVQELIANFSTGKTYLDATQRKPSFVDGIIKKHLYFAVKNEEKSKISAKAQADIDSLGGVDAGEKWYGDCAIKFVRTKKGFACTDGGHRNFSFEQFVNNAAKCSNFLYPDNTEIAKFFEKLAKDMGKDVKDSFTFDELPAKYKRAFLNLPLYCLVSTSRVKNAAGEDFIDSNKQKNQNSVNLLNATFANTEFYKIFSETAKCIANYNLTKGLDAKSTPSWYNKAKKSTQESYVDVCKGLKYTGKKHAAIFKLLLRCANCAEWEGGTSYNVHYDICDTYKNMSKTSCVDLVMNTIDNMAMVPKLIDTDYLDGINVWTAVVYTFGVPSYKSYAVKTLSSAKRKPLAISGRFLKNKETFNNAFGDCVAGNKTTFKGSNLVLTSNSKDGMVFVPKMLRESPSGRKNLTAVAMVLTAIYNETKEVK